MGKLKLTDGVNVPRRIPAFAALRFRPYGPSLIYWITRSARLSTSGGIVTPMSRAVLRFTISS